MAPAAITPESTSGTATPTTTSTLTASALRHSTDPTSYTSPLSATKIHTTLTTHPRPVPHPNSPEVHAQKTCTDHMITASWTLASGWATPELKPYGPLSLMPTASVLHYATECFEGLKLYRGHDSKLRLFRPLRNCQRMQTSVSRIALPSFAPEELLKMIVALCARDGPKWLPKEREGGFLYVRPTCIATDDTLGVKRPEEALLYVVLACFPDMTRSLGPSAPPALQGERNGDNGGEKKEKEKAGLKLLASNEDTIRAWPGGFGYAKVGANYGPTLVAQGEARKRGYDQVLWLFGKEGYVTEAGASNFFVVMRNKGSGKLQLITAPLEERIILEGVTRASVLDLARERLGKAEGGKEEVEVVERRFTMNEIVEAEKEGRLVEAFAAGTAFFIAPIGKIHFRGKDIEIPMGEDGESGVYASTIKQWLVDIMYGNEQHEWGYIIDEVEE